MDPSIFATVRPSPIQPISTKKLEPYQIIVHLQCFCHANFVQSIISPGLQSSSDCQDESNRARELKFSSHRQHFFSQQFEARHLNHDKIILCSKKLLTGLTLCKKSLEGPPRPMAFMLFNARFACLCFRTVYAAMASQFMRSKQNS
jgi:hypothetical protein